MNKSMRSADWARLGLVSIFISLLNLYVYLQKGIGLTSRMGHKIKGLAAVLATSMFFIFGLICLGVWLMKRPSRRTGKQR